MSFTKADHTDLTNLVRAALKEYVDRRLESSGIQKIDLFVPELAK
jgi:hypothetical protein